MKKQINILIGLLILLQTGGFYFVFQMERLVAKHRMAEDMENTSMYFETLFLSSDEYATSLVGASEIRHHGQLYDIKSVHQSEGCIELKVIHDENEEKIIERINSFSKSNKENDRQFFQSLSEMTSLVYVLPSDAFRFFILTSSGAKHFTKMDILISTYFEISLPPPEILSA